MGWAGWAVASKGDCGHSEAGHPGRWQPLCPPSAGLERSENRQNSKTPTKGLPVDTNRLKSFLLAPDASAPAGAASPRRQHDHEKTRRKVTASATAQRGGVFFKIRAGNPDPAPQTSEPDVWPLQCPVDFPPGLKVQGAHCGCSSLGLPNPRTRTHVCADTHLQCTGDTGKHTHCAACRGDQAETPPFLSALPEELTFLSVSVFTLKMKKDDFKHLNELSRLNHSLSPCFLHYTRSYLAELRGGGKAAPHQLRVSKGGPGYPEPAPPTARLKVTSAVSSGCAAI